MHDFMQNPIQGQGQEHFKVRNLAVIKSYLLCHLQWELATDHGFLNLGIISKFDWARLSRNFAVGTTVSCEELTISPHMGITVCYNSVFSFIDAHLLLYCPR